MNDARQSFYRQVIDGCTDATIGAGGLTPTELNHWRDAAGSALLRLKDEHRAGKLELLDCPADIEAAASLAETTYRRLADGAKSLVFFGTGGSSLGGQTLAQFGGWNIPGTTSDAQRARPMTRFYGNLDPATMSGVLARPDLASHRFVLVSKSGGTPETISQALAALSAVRDAGLAARIPEMFLAISDPPVAGKSNGLRDLCTKFDIPVLDHPAGVGGRFAVLTIVGLLPAVARGIDVRALLAGAQSVVETTLAASQPDEVPAAIGAGVAVGLARNHGTRVLVMMPYNDRLAQLAHWFVQLWAESLGKDGQGTTPLACLGPLDQHSQLQLFMDGPKEHYLTFVRTPLEGTGPRIPGDLAALAGLEVMSERTIGDLVAAQTVAVPEALRQAGRPVRIIDVPQLDAHALGALLMHFMIETVLAGYIMGVDPFGQPAVELGKQLTRQRLAGRTENG
ncbi:MAG: glucose-6-phosphate isomerase [Hyphomicrobiaceae bacterium]